LRARGEILLRELCESGFLFVLRMAREMAVSDLCQRFVSLGFLAASGVAQSKFVNAFSATSSRCNL
jgi:hypothetical protein